MAAGETGKPGGKASKCSRKKSPRTWSCKYLLYLPKGYGENKDQKWPLMLFLHGAGERGNDINKVKVHGPPKLIEQGKDLPFIVVSPQCPVGKLVDRAARRA